MNGQIMICDRIEMNRELRYYELGRVLNDITVTTLPTIQTISILVKLFYVPLDGEFTVNIRVYDDDRQLSFSKNDIVLKNFRAEDQIPGVDLKIDIPLLLYKTGNHIFELYDENQQIASYPITVRRGIGC